jgi:tRNA nucleotidyltransferase (CCA-adding enzyme)
MDLPGAAELLARVRSLPAMQPLAGRLRAPEGVYLVGGAVRDLLLGGTPFDLDFVVEGDAAAFAGSLGGELKVHDRFGTSTVTLGGLDYDVARARRETYSHPGALPDVEPGTLEEDLRRRDFAVNAIAIALDGSRPGEVHAVAHALEDLEGRRLRVLHDLSFVDDPTRLLRLVRYASRLGFGVEPRTRDLVRGAVRARALQTVTGARVGNELRLLAREDDPVRALRCLRELELDDAIHPGFGLREDELARRALELLPDDGRPDRLVLALAARALPGAEIAALLDRLAFEAEDRDVILGAATRAEDLAASLRDCTAASEVAAAAAGAPPELVALAGALGPADQAREWLARLRHVRLSIDGHDLLESGVPEGPAIGRGLRAALAAKLDGRAHGRDEELDEALRAAGGRR